MQDAINAVQVGTPATITLLKNIEVSTSLSVSTGKEITFDFQNYTISNSASVAIFENDGTISISNGTITSSASVGAINNNSNGTLTVSGGTISATGSKQAIYNNGGTTTITGNANLSTTSNQRATVHNLNGGTMYITGGTIKSTRFMAVDNMNGTLIIGQEDGSINTSSPVIQGYTYGIGSTNQDAQVHPEFSMYDGIIKYRTAVYNSSVITLDETEGDYDFFYSTEVIGGTTYNTAILATSSTITFDPNGGTMTDTVVEYANGEPFGTLPVPDYVGYSLDGWFDQNGTQVTSSTIVTHDMTLYARWTRTYLAEINGVPYDTIKDALNAITTSTPTTIEIVNNVSLAERIKIVAGRNITIDLQGHTIDNKPNTDMPLIENHGTLTVTNGTMASTSPQAIINNETGGNLTVNGANLIATSTKQAIYNNKNATVTITGSSYLSNNSADRPAVQNLAGGIMYITGGTIVSEKQEAVKNAGTLRVGTEGGGVSTSVPELRGATYGVTNSSTFRFYDGVIRGRSGTISGSISAIEPNYQKTEIQETINSLVYYSAYLVPAV